MEGESEGKAEDGFSWIAFLKEVKKNRDEVDIANVSLALICEETEDR